MTHVRDACLGTMMGNLYAGKIVFEIHPRIAYNLADRDFGRTLTLYQDFKRTDLMTEGNMPYSITYRISYALSNTHHSERFLRGQYVEIDDVFKDVARVMPPEAVPLSRIEEIEMVIQDKPVVCRTMSLRGQADINRISFSDNRISFSSGRKSYSGESSRLDQRVPRNANISIIKAVKRDSIEFEAELRCPEGWRSIKVILDIQIGTTKFPGNVLYHLGQPRIGKYEGLLMINGREVVIIGEAGREQETLFLGMEFLEEHKPWGRTNEGIEFTIDGAKMIAG